MRPLFAIAPLALLLAFAGPRPVRWDQGEQAVKGIASEVAKPGSAASAPAGPLGADRVSVDRMPVGRMPAGHLAVEPTSTASFDTGRGHGGRDLRWGSGLSLGLGLRNVAAEAPPPHGLPR